MRRTEFKRSTPMPAPKHWGVTPEAQLQAVEGKSAPVVTLRSRPRDTGFSAKVKMDVRKRAGNGEAAAAECEACGRWLGVYGGQVQHRRARMAGGSSSPVINSIVNAALLCGNPLDKDTCHGKCENRDRDMLAAGFWLENGQSPDTEPIMLHSVHGSGITMWLLSDGSYGYEEPGEPDGAA